MRNGIMHYLVKLYLFMALCVFSTLSQANQDKTTSSIGAFEESEGERSGLELSVVNQSDYIGFRTSLVLYSGGNNVKTASTKSYSFSDGNDDFYLKDKIVTTEYETNETYLGLSGFFFVHTGQLINPYLGLGVFIGKTQHCTDNEELYEDCLENYAAAVYPEFGIEFNIVKVQIIPYIRRYLDTSDSRTSGNIYGINIGMSF